MYLFLSWVLLITFSAVQSCETANGSGQKVKDKTRIADFKVPQYCIAHLFFARFLRPWRVRIQNVRGFPQAKVDSEINAPFLLNEDVTYIFYFKITVYILSFLI